jgi:cold shock CspA family protein
MSGESVQDVSADSGKTAGCVKWFNNKAGYGFVNVTSGDHTGTDIFVHHSAIQVGKEQYKYLVQGEYVQFDMCKADAGSHEWQAGNVRGLNNGKLMCETRFETRAVRGDGSGGGGNAAGAGGSRRLSPNKSDSHFSSHPTERIELNDRENSSSQRIRYRGPGPREGEEWMLVRRRVDNKPDVRRGDNRRSASGRTNRAINPSAPTTPAPQEHTNDDEPTFPMAP